jgi:hypothetical protein
MPQQPDMSALTQQTIDDITAVPLTGIETCRFVELETVVERGLGTFVEVGNALAEIRDRKLYRQTHGTFAAYCEDRWNVTDRRARQMIAAAEIGTIVPVGNEGQARELVGLDPGQVQAVYSKAAETTNGKPTAKTIRQARNDQLSSARWAQRIHQVLTTNPKGGRYAVGRLLTEARADMKLPADEWRSWLRNEAGLSSRRAHQLMKLWEDADPAGGQDIVLTGDLAEQARPAKAIADAAQQQVGEARTDARIKEYEHGGPPLADQMVDGMGRVRDSVTDFCVLFAQVIQTHNLFSDPAFTATFVEQVETYEDAFRRIKRAAQTDSLEPLVPLMAVVDIPAEVTP